MCSHLAAPGSSTVGCVRPPPLDWMKCFLSNPLSESHPLPSRIQRETPLPSSITVLARPLPPASTVRVPPSILHRRAHMPPSSSLHHRSGTPSSSSLRRVSPAFPHPSSRAHAPPPPASTMRDPLSSSIAARMPSSSSLHRVTHTPSSSGHHHVRPPSILHCCMFTPSSNLRSSFCRVRTFSARQPVRTPSRLLGVMPSNYLGSQKQKTIMKSN